MYGGCMGPISSNSHPTIHSPYSCMEKGHGRSMGRGLSVGATAAMARECLGLGCVNTEQWNQGTLRYMYSSWKQIFAGPSSEYYSQCACIPPKHIKPQFYATTRNSSPSGPYTGPVTAPVPTATAVTCVCGRGCPSRLPFWVATSLVRE